MIRKYFSKAHPKILVFIFLIYLCSPASPAGANSRDLELMMDAVRINNIGAMKTLAGTANDLNMTDNDGRTVLMHAAANGLDEIVRILIKSGADVNIKTPDGWTALMFAAARGREAIVGELLAAKADPNSKDGMGRTALLLAVMDNYQNITAMLAENGADVNVKNYDGYSAFYYACEKGMSEAVKSFLKKGVDIDAKSPNGMSGLEAAEAAGHAETVNIIRRNIANASENGGITALMSKSEAGETRTAKTLVAWGANIEDKDAEGQNALFLAVSNGFADTARMLLNKIGRAHV